MATRTHTHNIRGVRDCTALASWCTGTSQWNQELATRPSMLERIAIPVDTAKAHLQATVNYEAHRYKQIAGEMIREELACNNT